jgi:hypothetical protein
MQFDSATTSTGNRGTWDDDDLFPLLSHNGAAELPSAPLVRISHNDSEQVRTGLLVKLRKVQQI